MGLSNDQRHRRRNRGVAQCGALIDEGKAAREINLILMEEHGISIRTAKAWTADARAQAAAAEIDDPLTQRNYEDERMRMAEDARARSQQLLQHADAMRATGATDNGAWLRTLAEARSWQAHVARLLHFWITPPDRLLSQADTRDKLIQVLGHGVHFFTDGEIARCELAFAEERGRRKYEDSATQSDDVLRGL